MEFDHKWIGLIPIRCYGIQSIKRAEILNIIQGKCEEGGGPPPSVLVSYKVTASFKSSINFST